MDAIKDEKQKTTEQLRRLFSHRNTPFWLYVIPSMNYRYFVNGIIFNTDVTGYNPVDITFNMARGRIVFPDGKYLMLFGVGATNMKSLGGLPLDVVYDVHPDAYENCTEQREEEFKVYLGRMKWAGADVKETVLSSNMPD